MKLEFKSQKASITIFVIFSMMFALCVLSGMQYMETNKLISQAKEIQGVEERYNQYDLNKEYNKSLNNK